MAKTKTIADAVTRAQNEFLGITLATADSIDFANEINELILKGDRWDFMTAAGTTFGTTAYTQDYSNVPADFLWMKAAWIQDDSSSRNRKFPLDIKDALESSAYTGQPSAIAVELETKFRLFPVPSVTRVGTGQWAVSFEYYRRPTRLTAVGNSFQFDDMYWEVFSAGFVARVGEFIGEEGSGQWLGRDPSGSYRGTGLWGKFAAYLNDMVASESRASEEPVIAPAEGLLLG
jgi:hypothetical protein